MKKRSRKPFMKLINLKLDVSICAIYSHTAVDCISYLLSSTAICNTVTNKSATFKEKSYIPFQMSLWVMKKSFLCVLECLMKSATPPPFLLLGTFPLRQLVGGCFIQQSTKSQPPLHPFFTWLSLSLSFLYLFHPLPLSHTLPPSFCLSLLPGIGVRYLVPFSTSPHY